MAKKKVVRTSVPEQTRNRQEPHRHFALCEEPACPFRPQYHGQTYNARMLLLKDGWVEPERLAVMCDEAVSEEIGLHFLAFRSAEHDETIYLLPREHFNLLRGIERGVDRE